MWTKRRKLTPSERSEVFAKTDGRCAYCGCELKIGEMQIDHRISLHNHGSDEVENLLPSCHDCNYYKAGCNPEGFRKKLKKAFRQEKRCDFVQRLEDRYEGWNGVFYFERMEKQLGCDDEARE